MNIMRNIIYIAILFLFTCADCAKDKPPQVIPPNPVLDTISDIIIVPPVYSSVLIDTNTTIKRGFELLGNKDTLQLMDGVYREIITIPSNKVLTALNRRKATIRPDSTNWIAHFVNVDSATVKGFILDGINIRYSGIHIGKKSNHNKILDNEIINTHFTGILINQESEYNLIEGNEIHDFGTDKWDHGVYIGSNKNIVRNNTIYNITGNGVLVYRSSSISVDSVIVEHNKIDSVGFFKGKELNGAGIMLSRGTGHVARYNTVSNSKFGIAVRYGAKNALIKKNHISNNRFGLYFDYDVTYINKYNTFDKNIKDVTIVIAEAEKLKE